MVLFSVLGFFALSSLVEAAPAYSVSPLVIDIDAKARDILTKEITITNTGTQPVTVYPSVNNISLEEGGTIEAFLPPSESDRTQSLASWLEVNRLGIDLKVGESRTVPITLRIHPSPVPGTYHAFIGFGHGRNRDEAEKLIMSGRGVGTVMTVNLENEKMEFLKLSGFVVERFITSDKNNIATYTFRNPGDEVLIPKGEIIFYDKTGKEVAAAPVNTENVRIAPGGEHVFETEVPFAGLFGKYKAFLSVEYGTAQRASVQDINFFYVLPLRIIIILCIGLVILAALGGWYVHRKYFDEDDSDDSERLMVHVREGERDPLHHDINLKNNKES
jgi:hypothetical protein